MMEMIDVLVVGGGTAAAIASKNKVSPIDVPLEVLKKILIENNAIVPSKRL